ncbi:DNA (cytosine-5)-methyltransferase 1 [Silvibacterium bohemicum]|uniref:Cytosine-specific methyltransferase n=1 Tax=Silvibacterium bohemicum TaxID=1577686 RepID=A0A841K1Q1_9BACT|nr:DNA (cytosine-5-)-methyltransferase [Silvibacterium bohemicum]MBB6147330.1 DNA (cytosine-5)-methyltransferase 1 [Silvibacterium bohemicum]
MSVAWQPLGWKPAMFAEIDPFCCWLLSSRYRASRPIHMPSPHDAPDRNEAKRRAAAIRNVVALPADGAIVNAGDFTKIGADDVGAIDLLAGGTPCQSFSVAGKRAGLDNPRGNLTIEFARLAGRFRPLWLVWENVPGVLSIDDGRTFGAFLGMLVELGYGVAYRVLNAQHFGVPQRRRRVFVVGCLGNWRAAAAVLLERHSLSGYPPPRRETRKRTAAGVEVGPAGGRLTDIAPTIDAGCKDGFVRNQLGVGVLEDLPVEIAPTIDTHFGSKMGLENQHALNGAGLFVPAVVHSLSADGFDAGENGTGRGVPMIPVAISTAHTKSNGSGFSDHVAHTLESGGGTQAVAFSQNLRNEVRLFGGDGKTVGALASRPGVKQQSYIAFSAKDSGSDASDIAPTLRGMGHDGSHPNGGGQVAIAFAQNQDGEVLSGDVMQSLGTNSNATGRNAPTIAFTLHGSESTTGASATEVAASLRTRAPGGIENSSTTAVLQEQPVAWSGELTASTDVAGTLQRGGEGGRVDGVMTPQMAVRRLTPRECERLQGFPDDYTLVEYRGKMASDGPRYKALGNSMAVPVMRWIGQRIEAVDAILRDRPGVEGDA